MPVRLRWKVATPQPHTRDPVAAALGVHPVVAQVLVNRGHGTPEQARRFLDASLEHLTDPDQMIDVPRAADRLAAAVRDGDPITIYGDYDADGVTATAILLRGLAALGARAGFYIPSRFTEGYGLNHAALSRIAAGGGRLVVTVDCGVTAVDEVAQAKPGGLDVIIVDHHEPAAELPPAVAVVDPKRADVTAGFREFCAAGLAFQLLRAVRGRLGRPDLPEDLLELAALGTIADVVPLVGDNRILARAGLARMAGTGIIGLGALIRVAGLTGAVTAHHVGFSLGPRLNAAGRLGDASVAVRLLTTDDPAEAEAIAARLDEENRQRRALCDQILGEAVERVERDGLRDAPAIVLARDGWHAGVIGIVASQLVERYHRPAVIIALDGEVGKGSARSIEPFHMVDALGECADVLQRFGGHAMAAGLTVETGRVEEFARRFAAVAAGRLTTDDLVPSIHVDAEVRLADVTDAVARQLQLMAPFGSGNPEPVLAARGLHAVTTRVMSDGLHLGLGVTDGEAYAEAVGFRLGDASELLAFTRARLDLAFTVGIDRWNDRERVQLMLRDLATPGVDLDEVLTDSRLLVERLYSRAGDYLGDGAFGLEDAGAFYTKVAGVTFEGRQAAVQTLAPGDALILQREPGNTHDPHAIKVLAPSGTQIGYLSARVAARLAPTVDSGTRYSATVSQVTGGGDRSFGVNVYVQREEGSPDDLDPSRMLRAGWQELPPPDLLERLRIHLYRGRPFRAPQSEVLRRVLAGESLSAVFGPGRGRRSVVELVAAAAAVAGRRPVVIAVPLYSEVDRWSERLASILRQIGVQTVRAHGALLFRQRQRLQQSLHDGSTDVILASLEFLKVRGSTLGPALLLVEADSTTGGEALTTLAAAVDAPQQVVFSSDLLERDPLAELAGHPQVVDGYLRTNLRLVDRRETPDREGALAGILERGEKTLVYVATRADAVDTAARLRERAGREVAYYHLGLPRRVREVLEQMFADGKIPVLVAADGLREAGVPGDVRQVAIAHLPATREDLMEQVGTAGLDGRQAVATLLYGRADAAALEAALAERNPTREALAAIYRAVRDRVERDGAAMWPDGEFVSALGDAVPSARTVGIGLDVLAEAGVIQREFDGDRWRITPAGGGRHELATSLRHAEGQREREALAGAVQVAFGPVAAILQAVAGPAAQPLERGGAGRQA